MLQVLVIAFRNMFFQEERTYDCFGMDYLLGMCIFDYNAFRKIQYLVFQNPTTEMQNTGTEDKRKIDNQIGKAGGMDRENFERK